MPQHETLGKILTAFQLGARLAGTYYHHMAQVVLRSEKVSHAAHQRSLGTHYHHPHIVLLYQMAQSLEIHRVYIYVAAFPFARRTRVARCNKERGAQLAFGYLTGNSMFATTRSKKKNIHIALSLELKCKDTTLF